MSKAAPRDLSGCGGLEGGSMRFEERDAGGRRRIATEEPAQREPMRQAHAAMACGAEREGIDIDAPARMAGAIQAPPARPAPARTAFAR